MPPCITCNARIPCDECKAFEERSALRMTDVTRYLQDCVRGQETYCMCGSMKEHNHECNKSYCSQCLRGTNITCLPLPTGLLVTIGYCLCITTSKGHSTQSTQILYSCTCRILFSAILCRVRGRGRFVGVLFEVYEKEPVGDVTTYNLIPSLGTTGSLLSPCADEVVARTSYLEREDHVSECGECHVVVYS